MAWAIVLCLSCQTSATIVTFEDLEYDQNISGTAYQGIHWDYGSEPGVYFIRGSWMSRFYDPVIDDPDNNLFGTHSLTNSYGCTKITFQFPEENFPHGVAVDGAYFVGQGIESNWPEKITVTGFFDGTEVWSVLLNTVLSYPQWLNMDPDSKNKPIDQIAITVTPKAPWDPTYNEYGYFGMDNLSFEEVIVPEPMTLLLLTLGSAAIRRRK